MTEFAGKDLQAVAEMIRAERMIAEVTDRELQIWVTKFLDRMFANATPGIAPDTTVLEYLHEEWELDHMPVILAAATLAWKKRYKKKRKMESEASEAAFRSELTDYLSHVPDTTFKTATEAIQKGVNAGFTFDQILDSIRAEVLATVSVTSERTGRLLGPLIINDATVQSYRDSEEIDGEGPFFKSWVSVMDNHVRPTHVLANADDRNRNVPISGKFIVGGFLADHPRDAELPLWESAGCRCVASVKAA